MGIFDGIKCFAGKAKITAVNHAPQIMFGFGMTCMVAGIGLTIAKSVNPDEEVIEAKEALEEAKAREVEVSDAEGSVYTTKDYKKDIFDYKFCLLCAYAKNYALPMGLFGLSIGGFTGSYVTLNSRLGLTTAALGFTTASFSKYRKAVAERFGEEVDKELLFNLGEPKLIQDAETGDIDYELPEALDTLPEEGLNRFFDATSRFWDKSPDINLMTVKLKQKEANTKLRARGYMTLNDVFNIFDLPKSKMGQYIGWIYDPNKECQIIVDIYNKGTYVQKYSDILGCEDDVYDGDNVLYLHFNASEVVTKLWPAA